VSQKRLLALLNIRRASIPLFVFFYTKDILMTVNGINLENWREQGEEGKYTFVVKKSG
jgi:hypothetical protein